MLLNMGVLNMGGGNIKLEQGWPGVKTCHTNIYLASVLTCITPCHPSHRDTDQIVF